MKSAEHEHNAFLEDTELDKQPVADSRELEPEPQQCAAGSKSVLVPVEGNKVLEPEPRQRWAARSFSRRKRLSAT